MKTQSDSNNNNQKEQVESPSKTIYLFQYSEQIWFSISVLVFIFFSIGIYGLYKFSVNPITQDIAKNKYNDLWIIFLTGTLIWIWRDLIEYLFRSFVTNFIYTEGFPTYEIRYQRAKSICKYICDIGWYTGTTISCFIIVKDACFLPKCLFGSGDIKNAYLGYPFLQEIPLSKVFYLIQLGNYFYHLVHQICGFGNNVKFWEWILHHSLATFLITFSYYTNWMYIGLLVMLCHDGTDSILCITRVYNDYQYILYAMLLFVWIYLRIFVFPTQIVWIMIKFAYELMAMHTLPDNLQGVLYNGLFMIFMLSLLVIMHLYWTVFMVKGIFQQITLRKHFSELNNESPETERTNLKSQIKVTIEHQKLNQRNIKNLYQN